MLCGSLDGRGVQARMDTCISMAESLRCSLETITTLLIGLSEYKINAGRDWRQEEKGMTEGKMAGWHHRLDGHESG